MFKNLRGQIVVHYRSRPFKKEGSDSNMTKNKEGKDSPDFHGFAGLDLVLKDKNKRDNSSQQIFYIEKVKFKDPISDA